MGDIQLILESAIKSEMDINPTDFRNYNAILIIQDLFDKCVTYELTRLLFQDMGFSKVAFLQVGNHGSPVVDSRNRLLRHSEPVYRMLAWLISELKQRPLPVSMKEPSSQIQE